MVFLGLLGLTAGCGKNIKTREQVRADLIDHLSTKTGLEMKSLDIDVTKVTFEHDQAQATVSFHQKSDPSINGGMVMVYTLAPKDGHWVVVRRGDSQGHQFGGEPVPADQNLPPGHPRVDGASPEGVGSDTLPPGHPALAQPQGQAK
jgi:hypothetical protein